MLESQRSEIMEAMGLKVLVPRFMFGAAKATETFDADSSEDETAAPLEASSDAVIQAETATPQESASEKVFDDALSAIEKIKAPTTSEEGKGSGEIRQELDFLTELKEQLGGGPGRKKSIRFRHRILRVGQLLMMVDQPTLEWTLEKQAKAFFTDIHFALYKKRPEYWSEQQFDWPLAKNMPNADDPEFVVQTLSAYLQSQSEEPPCEWMIFWGKGCAKYLLDKSSAIGEAGKLAEKQVLLADDLQFYLSNPQHKEQLWQSMQKLRSEA